MIKFPYFTKKIRKPTIQFYRSNL